MHKKELLLAFSAFLATLSPISSTAHSLHDEVDGTGYNLDTDEVTWEKCIPLDKKGYNIVKIGRSFCATLLHNCAGFPRYDPGAWISVPHGMCAKINAGNFEKLPQSVLDNLDIEEKKAQTGCSHMHKNR